MSPGRGFDPIDTYVHFADDGSARPIPAGDDFWQTIGERPELHAGRLLIAGPMTATWDHWERHPAGDELVYVLSGRCTFVLAEPVRERTVELGPRTAAIVPRGVWHRAVVHEPGEMLFLTPGEGTEHKPL